MSGARLFSVLFLAILWHCSLGQSLTYTHDIKPILAKHCVGCHQPGEVGAMPLTSYEEVSAYGKMIQYVTTSKLMPPWYADPGYSHFANERVLTGDEIRKISDWVSSGMAQGDGAIAAVEKDSSFAIGNRRPDLSLSMTQAFEQYGIYLDQYQVFVLPTGLTEDTWIEGVAFVPGNKRIVRFASISVVSSDKFDALDQWDPRYGYYSFGGTGKTTDEPYWYTWSPQQEPAFFSDGEAKFLPKGSKLIVHVHYGPTGKPQTDSSGVELYFATQKPTRPLVTAPLINPYTLDSDSLFIPAGAKKIFHASYTLPYAMEVLSLTPQANLLCRSWEVYAKLPDKTVYKLLKIPEWNFNWKQTYYFESPISLPKGTVIHAHALYDNTFDNPCNPSDKLVDFKWGAHLFSELFFVHFEFSTPEDSGAAVRLRIPSVTDGSSLEALLILDKTDFAEIQICNPSADHCTTISNAEIRKGIHHIPIPVSGLQDGNYLIRIVDRTGFVLAEQLFVKMRADGL
jgi:hypothetical protein